MAVCLIGCGDVVLTTESFPKACSWYNNKKKNQTIASCPCVRGVYGYRYRSHPQRDSGAENVPMSWNLHGRHMLVCDRWVIGMSDYWVVGPGFEIKGSGGAKCSQIEPKCS